MQTAFADMIGNITLSGGVIRIDLLHMTSIHPETKEPRFEVSQVLRMPLDGFLRSLPLQEKIRDQLIANGVAKQAETMQITGLSRFMGLAFHICQ